MYSMNNKERKCKNEEMDKGVAPSESVQTFLRGKCPIEILGVTPVDVLKKMRQLLKRSYYMSNFKA